MTEDQAEEPAAPAATPAATPERAFPAAFGGVTEWLDGAVNSVQRARDAQRLITAVETVRDDALREAWSHRQSRAEMKDLAGLTGVLVPTIARVIYWPAQRADE